MHGVPSTDSGSRRAIEADGEGEQLRSILRQTSQDVKVIFGARRGVFDLTRVDIENFFHLVTQRVLEQNGQGPAICDVSIYYNDGTSRRFPNIEQFSEYSETNNRYPTVVTLHLSFLITFPATEVPEKQEIDLVIRASESTSETVDMVITDTQLRMSGDKIQMVAGADNSDLGMITYNINHSRVTWGLDLEGHVKGQIDRLMVDSTRAEKFLAKSSGPLNLFTTVFVGLYCVNFIIDGFFNFLYKTEGANNQNEVLQAAATYLVDGQIAKYIVASLVVSVVFFVAFSGFVSSLTRSMKLPKPSFICLDDRDKQRRAEKLKSYNKRWTKIATAVGLNVFAGALLLFLEDRLAFLFN